MSPITTAALIGAVSTLVEDDAEAVEQRDAARATVLRAVLGGMDRWDEVSAAVKAADGAEAAVRAVQELLSVDEFCAQHVLDLQIRSLQADRRTQCTRKSPR